MSPHPALPREPLAAAANPLHPAGARLPATSLRPLSLAAALAATLAAAGAWRQPALAGDLRGDCLALSRSHGGERVAIANRIGREHYLTKDSLRAEERPDRAVSLYRWSDIQRLCRP